MEFGNDVENAWSKYKKLEKIIPNFSFQKYSNYEPTVQLLELCMALLDSKKIKPSSLRKIDKYVKQLF